MARAAEQPPTEASDRTRVRRLPEKAVDDAAVRDAVLDAGRVAHVAVVEDGTPFVVPVAYARDGERLLIHGSRASRLFRGLADGALTCLTVTLLDGLVVARSAFESSMHYRSVMVLGTCRPLDAADELDGLRVITEHLLPGRWEHLRAPASKELAATLVLALPLDEWSVKVSDGPPTDDPADLSTPVWSGTVPLVTRFGEPVDAPDLAPGRPVPDHVRSWTP
jgi:uncharacterized protein